MNEINGLFAASEIILWGEDAIASDVAELKISFEESGVVFHEVSVHLVTVFRKKLKNWFFTCSWSRELYLASTIGMNWAIIPPISISPI